MIDTTFERLYRANIAKAIDAQKELLGNGYARESVYEYGRAVGTIVGLRLALKNIDETGKQMGGSEKSIAAEMSRKQ